MAMGVFEAITPRVVTSWCLIALISQQFYVQAEVSLLKKYSAFHETLNRSNGNTDRNYQIATTFAQGVANQRFYSLNLGTLSKLASIDQANYDKFQEITKHLMGEQLKSIFVADEMIKTLRQYASLSLEDLRNNEMVSRQAFESYILPACGRLVDLWDTSILGERDFAEALQGDQETLRREFHEYGGDQDVKQFLDGWTRYYICKSLLKDDDHSVIIHRIAARADDAAKWESRNQF